MKADTPIILAAVGIYSFGSYFGVAISRGEVGSLLAMDWATIISSTIAAAFGAVAGALAAFRLEEKRRQKVDIAKQVSDGRRILLDLFEIWNNLTQYYNEVMIPLEKCPQEQNWFQMKSTIIPYTADELLDPSRYEFLIGGDTSQLAADIRIERQRYRLFLNQVNERSRVMRELVRPRWEVFTRATGQEISDQNIEVATGPNLHYELRDMTQNIENFISPDIESTRECFSKLRDYLLSRFPGEKLMNFEHAGESSNNP